MGRPEEQGEEAGNGNGKRKVSGESDASKSGVKRENDEGDSTVMQ